MKKALLISVLFLLVGGTILLVILGAYRFDFDRMTNSDIKQNTYTVDETFSSLEIETSFTDIRIVKSTDGAVKAVCDETDRITYSVSVEDGKLEVNERDNRRWFEKLFAPDTTLTLYLPEGTWGELDIETSSGDILVSKELTFSSVNIEVSSGDVDFSATVTGRTEIEASSGDVEFKSATLGETEVETSSGEVTFDRVTASGNLCVSTSSGDIDCEELTAVGQLKISASSGDVELWRCDAPNIIIETSSGDVDGSLLTGKTFDAKASSGRVRVPDDNAEGGTCKIRTSSGDIEIRVAG